MPEKYVLVEHDASLINTIIRETFHTTQRIKVTAFEVSKNYIIFGANTGGIYIFHREPCSFFKLIPSTHGATEFLCISPNEHDLAIATSSGHVILIEACFSPNFDHQIFLEHQGSTITAMKWTGHSLYCGDSTGKVSVIFLKKFLAMFQTPSACLMHLDSPVIQIDAYSKFLLISTISRSLICDTETEYYTQIGRKLRDGEFGSSFLHTIESQNVIDEIKPRTWGVFKILNENEQISTPPDDNIKIYCSRPGLRLWLADFQGNVVQTHQFKAYLPEKPSDVIILGENEMRIKNFEEESPESVNFGKLYSVLSKFLISFSEKGFLVIEPQSNVLMHWCPFNDITDVKIIDSFLYILLNNSQVTILSLVTVEEVILRSLVKKKYRMCADLCLHFYDDVKNLVETSKNIFLISRLEQELDNQSIIEKLSQLFDLIKAKGKPINSVNTGIVTINVLPMIPETVQYYEQETNQAISIILEQYKISKIHPIETQDFTKLLSSLQTKELFDLLQQFQSEDCDVWCKEMFIKYLKTSEALPDDILDFAIEAFIITNKSEKLYSCKCGFPLPEAHLIIPKYYETGCKLIKQSGNYQKIVQAIPPMYKFLLSRLDLSEIQAQMPLMIQFSDLKIIEMYLNKIPYDLWDESVKFLSKVHNRQCVNCGEDINPQDCISWTDFGLVMCQSITPKNAIKLFERYANLLPGGVLEPIFYQYCIFSTITSDQSGSLRHALGKTSSEFENSVGGYLRTKYFDVDVSYGPNKLDLSLPNLRNCDHCHFPLREDQHQKIKKMECGHNYHNMCFILNKNHCSICHVL